MKNVQITAVRKEFKNGTSGWEVKVAGMEGKLECKMNFHDGIGSLKAMRYMYLLAKRLELQINQVQLAAVLLDYRRSKEAAEPAEENTEAPAEVVEPTTEVAPSQPVLDFEDDTEEVEQPKAKRGRPRKQKVENIEESAE